MMQMIAITPMRKPSLVADDDDSSYESALHYERSVVSDDVSLPRNGSCQSLASVESSFVGDVQNFDDSHESLDINLDNDSDTEQVVVEINFSPKQSLKKNRGSSSSGSIKDLLSFGSIHENQDYDSEELTEASSVECCLDDKEDNKKQLHEDDESSVGSDIIGSILKTSDSRERIHNGKRQIQTKSLRNSLMKDVQARQPDFLKNRKSSGKSKGFWKASPEIQRRKNHGNSKTSPTNEQNKQNEHSSKIQHSESKDARRSSKGKKKKKKSISGDPLMDRFLKTRRQSSQEKEEVVNHRQKQALFAADSINRICGKGKRVVGTQPDNRARNMH